MGLTNLTADLDLIQALDKRPNAIGGLSAAQLQAKFDEAANAIKTYINGTLIPELDTQVAALKAVNRLVYCGKDVPKTSNPGAIITVTKNWFYPTPQAGDTVLGKNMYIATVAGISGNDVTLSGLGGVLTPSNFDVLSSLSVLAVGGVGGNIVAEGDLSVSGYTGLAGDLDVTGDTDIAGDLDVVGNVTVTVDASVSGDVAADGDASVGGKLTVTGNGDIGGKLDVHGNVGVGGTLGVTGVASLGGELYVQDDMFLNGGATFGGDLDVTGDATVGGTLGVTGAATFGDEVLISSGGIGVQGAATFADGVGVTGDFSASGDGSIGGGLTVTGNATVGGGLTVTGGATFGDNVTLASGKTLTAGELATRGINLSDGIQGHEPVSIYGGNDEIELIGDNDGPVSLLNVKDISANGDVSASGDLYGTELNLTNNSNKSVQIEVSAENTINFNGTSDAPVVINNVDTPTENGHAANKSYVDSAVSNRATKTDPAIKGGLSWNSNGNPSYTIYGEVAEDELGLFGTGHSGQVTVSGIATPTSNYDAANKAYVDSVAGVTAASVATAIGNFSSAQAAQAVSDLGAAPAETVNTLTGATQSITPAAGSVYKCGELTSLTITSPAATGAWSVVFTSGSTATTTTIPSTILGLESFAAEANTMYEINVLDNRAVVGSWAVSNNA